MIAALLVAAALQHWLVVNDIHLDPFSHAGVVRGADTTPVLWHLSVPEMRRTVPNPRVIILGGDNLAHHFPTLAVDAHRAAVSAAVQVDQTIAHDLGTAYPNAQFLVAQGNNDDPCGDYRSETGGPYLQALARIWQPLVDRHGAAPGFTAQFMHGGYYTAKLPIAGGEAIVLNSDIWSIVYGGGCSSQTGGAGRSELVWLQRELSRLSRGDNAVVVMHIPPGYDPDSTMLAHRFLAVPFLRPDDNTALMKDLAAHASQIRAIYGAHTHRYDFRLIGTIPMFIGSSISPVYNNNPAFYDVTVDASGNIHDIVPYVYDLRSEQWLREPSFDHMYGVKGFTAAALASIAKRIVNDPQTRATWEAAYDVWSWRVGDLYRDWVPFACAHTQQGSGYAGCAKTSQRTKFAEIAILCIVILFVAIVVGLLYLRAKRRNRA